MAIPDLVHLDPVLITATSTLAGAIVGGLFTYLAARRSDHIARLEDKIRRLSKNYASACRQIEGYYHLETKYCFEVAKLTSQPENQTKIKFRDAVESDGHERPLWTAKDAKSAIKDIII